MKAIAALPAAILLLAWVPAHAQAPAAEIADVAKIVGGGRYMVTAACKAGETPSSTPCCAPISDTDPLLGSVLEPYKNYRAAKPGVHHGLQNCRYRDHGLETRVIMLNPTAERVAEWTISACREASAKSMLDCARWTWSTIFERSGTQFAVAGPVIEPYNGKCWNDKKVKPGPHVGFTFRDGVTVRHPSVEGVCDVSAERLAAEPSQYITATVSRTTSEGPSRVTMLTRQQYETLFSKPLPASDPDANGSIEWLVLVRRTHMDALGETSHPWLNKLVTTRLPAKDRNKSKKKK